MMDSPRAYWPLWIDSLRKQGLTELAAWLLEAAGPLNILGAQLLYLGQPFIPSAAAQGWHALANLLEQEDESRAFSALLKGKPQ
jgi:hypothetical protein